VNKYYFLSLIFYLLLCWNNVDWRIINGSTKSLFLREFIKHLTKSLAPFYSLMENYYSYFQVKRQEIKYQLEVLWSSLHLLLKIFHTHLGVKECLPFSSSFLRTCIEIPTNWIPQDPKFLCTHSYYVVQ
jgi:hypothetical protein